MKTGILTFHASHNYGSILQAYALQQTVLSLGHECEIINFRTERQRRFYRPFYAKGGLRGIAKAIMYPRIARNDNQKYHLFERFLHENLHVSEETYKSLEQLRAANLPYDAIIAGSDQIWNTICFDHDRAFFLPFAPEGCRKIAYAPSMGPCPEEQVAKVFDAQIRADLESFSAISVREERTADRLETIIGRHPAVTVDPTLLLTRKQWQQIIKPESIVKGDYILYYSPWNSDEVLQEATRLSEKFKMPIVVSNGFSVKWTHRRDLKIVNAVGPAEFLNLLANAQLVVSGSFHAVVFSLLFDRQLYAYDGASDARVNNLLNITGLQHVAQEPETLVDPTETARLFAAGRHRLEPLRAESLKFLKNALDQS